MPARVRAARQQFETSAYANADANIRTVLQTDFDTSAELLYRFIGEFIRYTETYVSLGRRGIVRERLSAGYVSKTTGSVVAATFVRTALVIAVVASFWIATDWPSGSLDSGASIGLGHLMER